MYKTYLFFSASCDVHVQERAVFNLTRQLTTNSCLLPLHMSSSLIVYLTSWIIFLCVCVCVCVCVCNEREEGFPLFVSHMMHFIYCMAIVWQLITVMVVLPCISSVMLQITSQFLSFGPQTLFSLIYNWFVAIVWKKQERLILLNLLFRLFWPFWRYYFILIVCSCWLVT